MTTGLYTIIVHFRDGRAGFYRWRQGPPLSFTTPLRRLAWRGSLAVAERIVSALHRSMATGARKDVLFVDAVPVRAQARRNAHRVSGGILDAAYRGTLAEYAKIVGPHVARKLAQKRRLYEKLIRQIDKDYAIGRVRGIECKEQRAERLLEELDSYAAIFGMEAEDEALDTEADLVHYLAVVYTEGPGRFGAGDRESWIGNMRGAIVDSIRGWGRQRPTDAQVLEIARDAAHRWTTLRQRYKAARARKAAAQ